MSKCKYCNVEVFDETEYCPLCHGVLEHDDITSVGYPNFSARNRKLSLVLRIVMFTELVLSVIFVYLNFKIKPEIYWSVIAIASMLYIYWMLDIMSKEDMGYRKRTLMAVFGGVILVVLIDVILGFRGWSVDYVFPAAMIAVDIAIFLLIIINHRSWESYLILQIGMIFIGLISLLLILLHVVTHPMMSEIAFFFNLFAFLGTLILGGKSARIELKRRFHIK